jgi:hypothetical protein
MKRTTLAVLALALGALSAHAPTALARQGSPPVTITLVRWPFT